MINNRDETDRFSLGEILARMRAITRNDLVDAYESRSACTNGERLGVGEILVSRGKVTGEQLEIALVAQKELRSSDKSTRAAAAARLAKISGARVIQIARECRDTSTRLVERVTGEEYPVVLSRIEEG